jgi:hypothetical protein
MPLGLPLYCSLYASRSALVLVVYASRSALVLQPICFPVCSGSGSLHASRTTLVLQPICFPVYLGTSSLNASPSALINVTSIILSLPAASTLINTVFTPIYYLPLVHSPLLWSSTLRGGGLIRYFQSKLHKLRQEVWQAHCTLFRE